MASNRVCPSLQNSAQRRRLVADLKLLRRLWSDVADVSSSLPQIAASEHQFTQKKLEMRGETQSVYSSPDEMYAGRVARCPWWVTVSMMTGQAAIQSDRRTPDRYIMFSVMSAASITIWTGDIAAKVKGGEKYRPMATVSQKAAKHFTWYGRDTFKV